MRVHMGLQVGRATVLVESWRLGVGFGFFAGESGGWRWLLLVCMDVFWLRLKEQQLIFSTVVVLLGLICILPAFLLLVMLQAAQFCLRFFVILWCFIIWLFVCV